LEPLRTLRINNKYHLSIITEKIISSAIEVHKNLGPGLLESVYERALAHEFKLRAISFERQKQIILKYKNHSIGNHRIDFLVEEQVILELKAVDMLHSIYEAQLLTNLRATNSRIGLLINFNVKLLREGIKRFII
jgi:GxxExxY protein